MAQIECPRCQTRFAISPTTRRNEVLTCPACDQTFPATRDRLVRPPRPTAPAPPPSGPLEAVTSAGDRSVEIDPVLESVSETLASPSVVARRRRKRRRPAIVVGILGILAIGLSGLLWYVVQERPAWLQPSSAGTEPVLPKTAERERDQKPSRAEPDAAPDDISPAERDHSAPKGSAETEVPPTEPPIWPLLAPETPSWSEEQQTEIWQRLRPRLVRLRTQTPLGPRESLGTLIDSRGWVVASLRAVADGTPIVVRQLEPRLGQLGETELLEDQVRSVVAVFPQWDLAVLEINRRFVVALGDYPVAESASLESGAPLLAPGLPAVASLPVLRTGNFSALSTGPGRDANRAENEAPSEVDWIEWAMPPETSSLILDGAPLLNVEGEITGWIPSREETGPWTAVPAAEVIAQVRATPSRQLSLAALREAIPDATPSGPPPLPKGLPDDPRQEQVVSMNQAAEACARFQWNPGNAKEYAQIQEWLRATLALQTMLAEIPDAETRAALQRQIDHWNQALDREFAGAFSDDRATRLNELAVAGWADEDPGFFLVCGSILFSAADGPRLNQRDAVTFRLADREELITVPFDPAIPRMLPGQVWLLACIPPAPQPLRFSYQGRRFASQVSSLAWVIGPLEEAVETPPRPGLLPEKPDADRESKEPGPPSGVPDSQGG